MIRKLHGLAIGFAHGFRKRQDIIVRDAIIVENLPHIRQFIKDRVPCRRIDRQEHTVLFKFKEISGFLPADAGFFCCLFHGLGLLPV